MVCQDKYAGRLIEGLRSRQHDEDLHLKAYGRLVFAFRVLRRILPTQRSQLSHLQSCRLFSKAQRSPHCTTTIHKTMNSVGRLIRSSRGLLPKKGLRVIVSRPRKQPTSFHGTLKLTSSKQKVGGNLLRAKYSCRS